jgi:hypothetical protein
LRFSRGPRGLEPRTCGLRVRCEGAGQELRSRLSCGFTSLWFSSFRVVSPSFTGMRRGQDLGRRCHFGHTRCWYCPDGLSVIRRMCRVDPEWADERDHLGRSSHRARVGGSFTRGSAHQEGYGLASETSGNSVAPAVSSVVGCRGRKLLIRDMSCGEVASRSAPRGHLLHASPPPSPNT